MQVNPENPNIELLSKINDFCSKYNVTETSFGSEAINDPNLVRELKDGREPRSKTRHKILAHISSAAAQ